MNSDYLIMILTFPFLLAWAASDLSMVLWALNLSKDVQKAMWGDLKNRRFVLWCCTFIISSIGLVGTYCLFLVYPRNAEVAVPYITMAVSLMTFNWSMWRIVKERMAEQGRNDEIMVQWIAVMRWSLVILCVSYAAIAFAFAEMFAPWRCADHHAEQCGVLWLVFCCNIVTVLHGCLLDGIYWQNSFVMWARPS